MKRQRHQEGSYTEPQHRLNMHNDQQNLHAVTHESAGEQGRSARTEIATVGDAVMEGKLAVLST